MKNLILYTAILICFVSQFFCSCNYLDVDDYYNETLNFDSIFSNQRNFEKYLWATADLFPDEGAIWGNTSVPGVMASDEGFSLGAAYNGMSLVLGEVTPSNAHNINIWKPMYQIIRKANIMLARIDEVRDISTTDRDNLLGYVYFMRAYAYYNLLMQYGPIINLGDDVLENNEDVEYYNRARSTYDESVEYICREFEKAANFMIPPYRLPITFFGRPSSGAALGLIARVRLQHASPLFNGQQAAKTYYSNWKRKTDGVNYVSQTYDESRWAVAAMAAKRVIDTQWYSLYTAPKVENLPGWNTPPLPANVPVDKFPNGAGGIDPFHSYSDGFTAAAAPSLNPEFLWARISPSVKSFTIRSFPVTALRGYNNLCVPQKIIDAYYMGDGRDINNSSNEYPYHEQGFLSGRDTIFSGYTLKGGTRNMYVNREMRFYASIGFSGRLWTANSTTEAGYHDIVVNYNYSANGGKSAVTTDLNSYAITGYVLTKFIHHDDAVPNAGQGAATLDKPFPIIRYAEILLSYVEALNNLTQSHTLTDARGNSQTFSRDVEQIKFYFNQIRFRVGLPGMTDAEAGDPAIVQQLIERERMIEFLHENRRFYDVRRWGIYENSENELMRGMNTDADGEAYYTRVPLNSSIARNRVVDKKFIFMPIMRSELLKAPLLDQNPGW